ncbi:MAG: serine/threonine-protein kinase [Candidatus Micrarchaeota archaeon]
MSVKNSGAKPPETREAPVSGTSVKKQQPLQEGPAGKAPLAPPVPESDFSSGEGQTAQRKDTLIGTKVDGRYKIEELLGSGGYGKVYLAKDEKLFGNKVALKMLYPPGKDENPMEVLERLNRFEREAQVASSLNHPNIVRVTDFGRTEDKAPYCVMEFVEGGSLQDEISSDRMMPLSRFFSIAVPVCDALNLAHEKGIIHRDLKPANILLTEPNGSVVPKISDFGLVKVVAPQKNEGEATQLTQVGSILGTPEYMPPEQITGRVMDEPGIDIYAMGVTMYQTLCKKIPFEEAFDRERRGELQFMVVQKMVQKERPKSPSEIRGDIPKELSDLIMECLEKDPQKRPPSMKAIKSSLERCARKLQAAHTQKRMQEPARAQAPKPAARPDGDAGMTMVIPQNPAPKRPGKMVVAGAIAGVLAAAGFGTVMLSDLRQSRGDRINESAQAPDAWVERAPEPHKAPEPARPARKTFQITFVTEPGGVEVSAGGETFCTTSGEGVCQKRVEEGAELEFEFRKDGHVAKRKGIVPDADMVVKVELEPIRKKSERQPAKLVPLPPREGPPAAKAVPKEEPRVKPAETKPEKHSPRITDEGDAPKKPRITDEGG